MAGNKNIAIVYHRYRKKVPYTIKSWSKKNTIADLSIQKYTGKGGWIIFDFVYASVLRKEGLYFGEAEIVDMVYKAGEGWQFGIEKDALEPFLAEYGLKIIDQKDAAALEEAYFTDESGKPIGKISGTHCLVTAEKK